MADRDPAIDFGTRLALVGRAGSGKTHLGKWFMLTSGMRWVVLDSKHDSGFSKWRPMRGLASSRQIARAWKEEQVVVIRPEPHENAPAVLDAYLGDLHDMFDGFGTFIDETYQVAIGGRPGAGLTGLVTRGRDRRQAVIMGMQRPAWVPKFVFSEANYMAILSLSLMQDRKAMFERYMAQPHPLA